MHGGERRWAVSGVERAERAEAWRPSRNTVRLFVGSAAENLVGHKGRPFFLSAFTLITQMPTSTSCLTAPNVGFAVECGQSREERVQGEDGGT